MGAAGNTLKYNIILTNTGTNDIENAKIADKLSPFVDYSENSDNGLYNNDTREVVWIIKNLQVGEAKTLTVNVIAQKLAGNVIAESSARAEAEGLRTRVSNNTLVLINVSPVVLSITSDPQKVKPGEEIAYAISYRNEGGTELKNLKLRVVLPTGVSYKNGDNAYRRKDNVLELDLPNLQIKEAGEKSFRAIISRDFEKEESITTTAIVSYTDVSGSAQKDVEAYVINTVEPGLALLSASLLGSLPRGFLLWFLITFNIATIAFIVYLLRKKTAVKTA